jgi:hypothetical protein
VGQTTCEGRSQPHQTRCQSLSDPHKHKLQVYLSQRDAPEDPSLPNQLFGT